MFDAEPVVVNFAADSSGDHKKRVSVVDSLLDCVLERTDARAGVGADQENPAQQKQSRLQDFLFARTVQDTLDQWLGADWREDPRYASADAISARLSADIAAIDAMLGAQVNAILHHRRFQKIEAAWRSLQYLTSRADVEGDPLVKIRVLSVRWDELEKDFERAVEFDQSQLFRKVYDEALGTPGGEPFGMLIGDYEISHRVSERHPHDDLSVLRAIAGVAACAFCPFFCAASPELLDLTDFSGLQVTRDHFNRLSRIDYLKWNAFRDDEDSRFVGVLLPRLVIRKPYAMDGSRTDRFVFEEDVSNPDGSGYLWGNPVFAYASVAIRAFATTGWLADIRGLRQDEDGGGVVTDLPVLGFGTDSPGVIPRPVTEVAITDLLERQLSEIGLLPLCDCKDTPMAVFASGQSLQRPKRYNDPTVTANAKISAMLPYILTVSQFAHYVKVIAKAKTGSYTTAAELERLLHDWIIDYVTTDREASTAVKSGKPLREADITVQPDPSRPGSFSCTMRLAPHYELDEMVGSIRLTTVISGS